MVMIILRLHLFAATRIEYNQQRGNRWNMQCRHTLTPTTVEVALTGDDFKNVGQTRVN